MLFGQRSNCHDASGDCYALRVEAPAGRPALHWDATFAETLSSGASQDWTVHVGASFADVAPTYLMYVFVETLLHNGVTEGCSAGAYCPTGNVTRAQMAMFIARAMAGRRRRRAGRRHGPGPRRLRLRRRRHLAVRRRGGRPRSTAATSTTSRPTA